MEINQISIHSSLSMERERAVQEKVRLKLAVKEEI
jgi:hypothetical protein